jgi:hypothetical protein
MWESEENGMDMLDRILRPCDINPRPGYYSGYGAHRRHMDGQKLAMVWRNVETACGSAAGAEFATMVEQIPSLAPTEFLKHLHALAANGWEWSEALVRPGTGIHAGDDATASFTALAIVDRIARRELGDETEIIREDFVARVAAEMERRDAAKAAAQTRPADEVDALLSRLRMR